MTVLTSNKTAIKTARLGLGRLGLIRLAGCPPPKLLELRPGDTDVEIVGDDGRHYSIYEGWSFEGEDTIEDGWTTDSGTKSLAQAHTGIASCFIDADGGFVKRTATNVHTLARYGCSAWALGNGVSAAVYIKDVLRGKWWFKPSAGVAGSWLGVETAAGECILAGSWVNLLGGVTSGSGQPEFTMVSHTNQEDPGIEIKVVRSGGADVYVDDVMIWPLDDPLIQDGYYVWSRIYPGATAWTTVRE